MKILKSPWNGVPIFMHVQIPLKIILLLLLLVPLIIFSFNRKAMGMQSMAPQTPPRFSIGSLSSNDHDVINMDFDPELIYAQVIAEAKMYAQMNSGLGRGMSCRNEVSQPRSVRQDYYCYSPPHLDPKARRSWKRLLSWRLKRQNSKNRRNNSNCPTSLEYPSSKSTSVSPKHIVKKSKTCYSAPVTGTQGEDELTMYEDLDEVGMRSMGRFHWSKPMSWGSSIAGALSPGPAKGRTKGGELGDLRYVPLNQRSYSYPTSTSRFLRETGRPIYLVT